jgi:predicted RNA-binding Zn-ribbon protein involved in translation (DUF1610 family)
MSLDIRCPHCDGSLHVREDFAGRTMKCPRCGSDFDVPAGASTAVTEELPAPRVASGPTMPCPRCGERILATARKCRFCKAWIEEEEEDERPQSQYKPCPKCGGRRAQRVLFTFWGSFYGPALLCHVQCPKCGCAYNGRTGRSNLIPAILFVAVPLLGIVGIFAALGLLIWSMSQR